MALCEIHRELEPQRLELHQANQQADQAQREKISLCGELELRNRFFQESQAKDCQEIEELRRICCQETGRARQARIDELEESYVSQLLTQIRDLQNKVNSLNDAKEFLRSRNSERLWSVPRSQSTLDYSEPQSDAKPRFWIAACYTEYNGYFGKRF